MGKLSIEIKSNTEINAIYFGVALSGYEYSDISKSAYIIELAERVKNYQGLSDAKSFFSNARQNSCDVYPFWPRAALLETAAFYIDDTRFKFNEYCAYVNSRPNLTEDEKSDDFFRWIRDFPKYLNQIKANHFFQEINNQFENAVKRLSTDSEVQKVRTIENLNILANDIVLDISTISVIICPLKCIYAADYFIAGSEMSVILGDFIPHSVIHEYLHLIIHPKIKSHKGVILSQLDSSKLDLPRSYFLGNDESGLLNAFEEHIVRIVSSSITDDAEVNVDQIIMSELASGAVAK